MILARDWKSERHKEAGRGPPRAPTPRAARLLPVSPHLHVWSLRAVPQPDALLVVVILELHARHAQAVLALLVLALRLQLLLRCGGDAVGRQTCWGGVGRRRSDAEDKRPGPGSAPARPLPRLLQRPRGPTSAASSSSSSSSWPWSDSMSAWEAGRRERRKAAHSEAQPGKRRLGVQGGRGPPGRTAWLSTQGSAQGQESAPRAATPAPTRLVVAAQVAVAVAGPLVVVGGANLDHQRGLHVKRMGRG